MVDVLRIQTRPIEGQKPGTSGLRKKTAEVVRGNYLPNFVQSTFNAIGLDAVKGKTIVVGGDGRYFNASAAQVILKVAAANGVGKVLVGQNAILCTPALSTVVRARKAFGGFILTASHNPGGAEADWGIKYNCENGGPAPEALTHAIFEQTMAIDHYLIAAHVTWPQIDLGKLGITKCGDMTVEVIDATQDYLGLLSTIFDFELVKELIAKPEFEMVFDSLNAVTGAYTKPLFVEQLGCPESACVNATPLEDFGGLHPDPNLTYAVELVKTMKYGEADSSGAPAFGCASDGDGDRNMVLGAGFFVSPSDSVAVIAANSGCIPYFRGGLKGVARSMPTSGALDRVAEQLNIKCYETPTGWKFFGNLMDSGKCSICGEESFGTGSDHVREKDGIWAVLAWLSILSSKNRDAPAPAEGKAPVLVSVETVVKEHWVKYGRNYYTRYDYEGLTDEQGDKIMAGLRDRVANPDLPGKEVRRIVALLRLEVMCCRRAR